MAQDYLVHHGVKGMRWGVRNQRTIDKYNPKGRWRRTFNNVGRAIAGAGLAAGAAYALKRSGAGGRLVKAAGARATSAYGRGKDWVSKLGRYAKDPTLRKNALKSARTNAGLKAYRLKNKATDSAKNLKELGQYEKWRVNRYANDLKNKNFGAIYDRRANAAVGKLKRAERNYGANSAIAKVRANQLRRKTQRSINYRYKHNPY